MAVLFLRVRVWSPKPLKLHFEFPRVVLMRTCGNKLAILKFIYLLVETADCGIVIVLICSVSWTSCSVWRSPFCSAGKGHGWVYGRDKQVKHSDT
ncbi:hypothetical protein AB3S75_047490 [Citrus x aurantiifolia]